MKDYFRPGSGLSLEPARWGLGRGVPGAWGPRLATCSARGGRDELGPVGGLTLGASLQVGVESVSWRPSHGGQTADPDGQREAQQKHHPEGERSQNPEATRREISCGTMAVGTVRFCCLRLSYLPDHSEHQNGHVSRPWGFDTAPSRGRVEDHFSS